LILTFVIYIATKALSFTECMNSLTKGFKSMVPAILILIFAWTLSGIMGAKGGYLDAQAFVETNMGNLASSGLATALIPALFFLIACGISFATGTSWGTFGILIPIVTAIFPANDPLLIIGMSACLAGSVCGDHCSPISDTTIMSSAGAQCNHVAHVSTQLPYALTVAGISFVGYLLFAFIKEWYIVLPIMAVATVATLFIIKSVTSKKA